jgi:formamidopyrimidine-DNA glycosylase
MPELAEVEYFRRQWDSGFGRLVTGVALHPEKRVFRGSDVAALERALTGSKLLGSEGNGKQMLFLFSPGASLGIHLGMSGRLSVEAAGVTPGKHDHLVLFQKERSLIYSDPRMFGRIRFTLGKGRPEWWRNLPPAILSSSFTVAVLHEHLRKGRRSPIKALLLDQALFPGIGNWMADEITWQIRVHPATPAANFTASQQHDLWKVSRAICRTALKTIGVDGSEPPKNWLIHRRWQKQGRCPRDGTLLEHATIAGRTTAWCPVCQKPGKQAKRKSS